jgi:hypothetical protein
VAADPAWPFDGAPSRCCDIIYRQQITAIPNPSFVVRAFRPDVRGSNRQDLKQSYEEVGIRTNND